MPIATRCSVLILSLPLLGGLVLPASAADDDIIIARHSDNVLLRYDKNLNYLGAASTATEQLTCLTALLDGGMAAYRPIDGVLLKYDANAVYTGAFSPAPGIPDGCSSMVQLSSGNLAIYRPRDHVLLRFAPDTLAYLGYGAFATEDVNYLTALIGVSDTCPGDGQTLVVQDDRVLVEVSSDNGTITRVVDKVSGRSLAPDRAAAESFRLVLLRPDNTTVTIIGKDQKLSHCASQTGKLNLRWDGPLKDTAGEEHKIGVQMDVRVSGGAAEFKLWLDNGADFKVREAWYPLIGGIQGFAPDASAWVPVTKTWEKSLAAPLGENVFGYPGEMNMSFLCVQSKSARRSIYFSSHDEIARHKVYHVAGLAADKGEDARLSIHHEPFTLPGESFTGSPVVLRFVEGDRHAAGKVYREWFKSAFRIAEPENDWVRRQSFFLFTMFMLPEGTINYTLKDIPRWAKTAKEHGLNAVQISGWQVGGHDNGYPYYIPDPRLGTWDELEEGIRACHKMGLKVFFFVNYQPVMIDSDWYKNELERYREWNPEGGFTWHTGWGMGTLWARAGHPKMETWADLGFPQFRKIIVDQFEKLAQIGADGVHVDKMFPAAISYNPDSPMGPDTSTWEGAIILTKEVMATCRKHNPGWAMSFETNWDRMLQFGGATWWVGNQLVTRSVFPENAESLALVHAYDYLGVNNAVRDGHHVILAPMSFAGGMDWVPMEGLNDYIRDVKNIQDKLQDTVFLGEVLGHDGVTMQGHQEGVEYSVFRNRRTGLRGCVLTNSKMQPRTQTVEGFDAPSSGWARVHMLAQRSFEVNLPAAIDVPAERIVFVEEMAEAGHASKPDMKELMRPITPVAALEPVKTDVWTVDPEAFAMIEDENVLVQVSKSDGSVTRIHDKKGGLDLILEPRLAGSWKFALPLPGKEPWQTIEANWIIGRQQKLPSLKADGGKLTLRWEGPLKNYLGEKYDASVTETIELTSGGVLFGLHIDNRTPYQVGETYFPKIGGIQGLGKTHGELKATELARPAADNSYVATSIFGTFENMPMFGDQGPEQFYLYPDTQPEPWVSLESAKLSRSVYVGAQDPADRQKFVRLELLPSSAGTTREDGNWPRAGELKGMPVGVELSFVDCAEGKPGEDYDASPVFVKFHDGDRNESRKIYEAWKGGHGN